MENMGLAAGLGAIGFWLFVAVIVVAGIWDGIRKRDARHETLRRIIESGRPIDDALVGKLLGERKRLDRDLRLGGVILLFAAPGLALLGWFVSLVSAPWLLPMLGVAALVGCVGIGLLVGSKFIERSDRDDDASGSSRPVAR